MKTTLLLLTLFSAQILFAQQKWNYPETPKIPVYDTIWGKVYQDDYRWMEDTKDQKFTDWLKAQKVFTDSVLNLIPGQKQLAEELRASFSKEDDYFNLQKANSTWIYRKADPNDFLKDDAYLRHGDSGKEIFWFNPEEKFGKEKQMLIQFVPFPSGNLVMLDVVGQGTEIGYPRFAEMPSGKFLTDSIYGFRMHPLEIEGVPYVIFYKLTTTDVRDVNFFQSAKLALHKIGSHQEAKVLFDIKDYPELNQENFHFEQVHTSSYSAFIYLLSFDGITSEVKSYYALKKDILKPDFRWKPIHTPYLMPRDGRKFYLKNDLFFYHTFESNPAGEVRLARFSQPDKKDTEILFTPPEGWVIHDITMIKDDILITTTKNSVMSKVYKYEIATGKVSALDLPENGVISIRPLKDEAIVFRSSWTESADGQLLNPKTEKINPAFFTSK